MDQNTGSEAPLVLLNEDGELCVEWYGGARIDLMAPPALLTDLSLSTGEQLILLQQATIRGLDVLLRTLARFEPMLRRWEQMRSFGSFGRNRTQKGIVTL